MPLPITPLLGRQAELTALSDAVAAGRRGGSGGLLVVGDAGVGKTSLVQSVAAEAAAAGDLVLIGHCVHRGNVVPYLPLVDALRGAAREFPEWAREFEDHPTVSELVTPSARRIDTGELYEDILGLLLAHASHQPTVFLLEDVHWADESTRDLLSFLLTRLPGSRVTLLLTVRADDLHRRHPLRPALAEWTRLPGVTRLALQPLDEAAVRELTHSRHPGPIDDEVIDRIYARSGGNPFFAEQLLGALSSGNGRDLPGDLADLVLVQVDQLSPTARHVVDLVAVAGDDAAYDLLVAVSDLSADELAAALREAVDAQVLVVSSPTSYRFRHTLLGEAVYDDVLPGDRVRLHQAFTAAIAAGAPGTDGDLARHAAESFDVETAYAAGMRAADAALDLAAPADALTLYQRAAGVAAKLPDADVVTLALKTATAASLAGDPFRAVTLVQRALGDLTDESRRPELLVALAEFAMRLDSPSDPLGMARQALELVPVDPPNPLRARAMSVYAHALLMVDEPQQALEVAAEAMAAGRAVAVPSVAGQAATTLAQASARIGDRESAERMLRDTVEQAARSGDVAAEIRGWHALAFLAHQRGDLDTAFGAFTSACECAERAHRPWAAYALDCRAMRVLLLAELGRLDESLAFAAETPGAPPPYARCLIATMSLAALSARADDRVPAVLETTRQWSKDDGMLAINAAYAELELLGRRQQIAAAIATHDEAITVLDRLWGEPWYSGRIRLHAILLGMLPPSQLPLGLTLLADTHRTAQHIARRMPHFGPEMQAWVRRADAEAARLRWLAHDDAPSADELVAAWQSAVDGFGFGNVLEQTRCRLRLAEALAARGDGGEARLQAADALEAARRMGAQPLAEAARAFMPQTAEAGDVDLTARERDVLELVAEGLSNRDIGGRLFISVKTVSVHVSNVLAKLDARSRTEAVALARGRGLLD